MLVTPLSGQVQKQAQRKYAINGFVRDTQNDEALTAANVVGLSSCMGAMTNEFGYYSLALPVEEVHLQLSYVDHQSDMIRLHLLSGTTLSVSLVEDQLLGEVIVMGSPNSSGAETAMIGAQHIPASEIRRLPVFFGEQDAIKALQLLPGV